MGVINARKFDMSCRLPVRSRKEGSDVADTLWGVRARTHVTSRATIMIQLKYIMKGRP
jgi:hypothetical protein